MPIDENINGFYCSKDVRMYLIRMNELLQIMSRAKVFGKPVGEDKSPTIVQIEKLVGQHLQCIFASVEYDLNIMAT